MATPQRLKYGVGPQQFADLYLPGGDGPYPIVILIHGGFWRNFYDLSLMQGLAQDLIQHGIAAWNIEYRRVGDPNGGWPGTLEDVGAATDFLPSLAAQHHLDLQRVITVGHSAGGHLALWLAARRNLPAEQPLAASTPLPLAGAVSLAGAIDLVQVWRLQLGNHAARDFLGGSPESVPERYATVNPATLLPLGIPQVLVHGSADDSVPLTVSQNYMQKATEAGDHVQLVELAGVDHFALIDAHSDAWEKTMAEIRLLLFQNV